MIGKLPFAPGVGTHRIFDDDLQAMKPRGKGLSSDTVIDFIVDYSASMRDILGTVYMMCSDLMDYSQYGSGYVRFGLTRFSDTTSHASWGQSAFTENVNDIQEALLAGRIAGGSKDGFENIDAAIAHSLKKFSRESVPAGERAIVLFTDSDIRGDVRTAVDCGGESIRSALLFVPVTAGCQRYRFPFVDREGTADKLKTPYIYDIALVAGDRLMKQTRTIELDEDSYEAAVDNEMIANQMMAALI